MTCRQQGHSLLVSCPWSEQCSFVRYVQSATSGFTRSAKSSDVPVDSHQNNESFQINNKLFAMLH